MNDTRAIFHPLFGNDWQRMPEVFRKHYANRAYHEDEVVVEGKVDVTLSFIAKSLSALMVSTRTLAPYAGKDIPTTVRFTSGERSNAFFFDRVFHYPGKKPVHFSSRMEPQPDYTMIEFTHAGVGWQFRPLWKDGRVRLEHRGYCVRLMGKQFRLPLELVFGKVEAFEEATGEDSFRMDMSIKHPLLGVIYRYAGEFTITEMSLAD